MALWTKLSVGQRIRWLIEERGMTQVEVADKVGITQASVSNWVTDSSRRPSGKSLIALAEALGANPTWILDGSGNPFDVAAVWSAQERELLAAFRAMDPAGRAALLKAAKRVTSSPSRRRQAA
jgi:transcriptional regulator with XRE-family HTH domain